MPPFFGASTRLQPGREAVDDVLLQEALGADARRKPLHRDRPAAQVRQHHRRDQVVVGGQLALGDAVVGEEHLVGMRDGHGRSRTTSRAALSSRRPSSRGWRSLSYGVHSVKATCTTISGRTQCTRSRGRPVPRGERRRRKREPIEPGPQRAQQRGVEAGADLAGEDQVRSLEVADQQRAEPDAAALRIGEAADDQFLRRLALHLQPVLRPAVLVGRAAALGDHALPTRAAGRSQGLAPRSGVTRATGGANGTAASSARRASSGSAVTLRPSNHSTSKTW